MSTIVKVNKFDGGHADDLRTFETDKSEFSKNFDIFTNPHMLIPIPDSGAETMASGATTDYGITDVIVGASVTGASSDIFVGLGHASGNTHAKFFSKSTLTIAWNNRAERSVGAVISNSLVAYQNLAFALEQNGADIILLELTNDTTITARGTASGRTGSGVVPFIHPDDQVLYGVAGSSVWSYNGTTFVDAAAVVPSNMTIAFLTSYGSYLVIGCKPTSGVGNSVCYLWDRETTNNLFDKTIDFGEGLMATLGNIGDTLVCGLISGFSATIITNKLSVKAWAGGEVANVREVEIAQTAAATKFKSLVRNRLYFPLTNENSIFCISKNKEGRWAVTKERYVYNGLDVLAITGFSLIGDIMWVGLNITGTSGLLYRTKFGTNSPSDEYTSSCIYRTSINPNMPLADRYREKVLESIQIALTGASTGSVIVKYSTDGGTWTTIISKANVAGEYVIEASNQDDAKALNTGRELQFELYSTGKAKIKEYSYRYSTTNTLNN